MRVVGLLSGGKDSTYSILKCAAIGHDVVALAHVCPPAPDVEADSWMYQSVGTTAIPLLAEALGLPLYTRTTSAAAKTRSLAYVPHPGDEVEDLVELLRDVKRAHPDVNAVCAGALWSDYQRLRVENAASRVGMLSLAPLWRRNQSELLQEMISVGVEAVIIKVAGVGLDASHLGRTLAEMQGTLEKLNDMYGSHVCGEGGEFETLVLSMPNFKKRLVLDNVETVVHEHSDVAPVAYLKVGSCHLEEFSPNPNFDPASLVPPVPHQLQPVSASEKEIFFSDIPSTKISTLPAATQSAPKIICLSAGDYIQVCCLSTLNGAEGVSQAASGMQQRLELEGFSLGDILYVWLNLASVEGDSYANANKAYNSVFGIPECVPPPSRACIAMPNGQYAVSIECIARRSRRTDATDARTLHVQSLSEWAPPCIGPYAQVVEDNGVTLVSGAIPMHAPFASIIENTGARAQTRGCFFNLKRTLEATRTTFDRLSFFVAYSVSPEFFTAIHEEFRKVVSDERAILAVVPCIGLPKNVLVEIRAAGSYLEPSASNFTYSGDSTFSKFLSQSGSDSTNVYSVRHGHLAFAKIFISSTGSCSDVASTFLEELGRLEKNLGHLLASQLYVASHEAEAMTLVLRAERGEILNFIQCAVVPGKARILGVLTLRCPEVASEVM